MLDLQTQELTYGSPLTSLLTLVLLDLKHYEQDITTDVIVNKMIEYRPDIAELVRAYNSRKLLLERIRNKLSTFQRSGLVTITTKKSSTKTNYLVITINFKK